MRAKIECDSRHLEVEVPCGLRLTKRGIRVCGGSCAGTTLRLVRGHRGLYIICGSEAVLVNGRRLITGLAKLTPGTHRIVIEGRRFVAEVPMPAIRVVGVEEHPLEECPVHHGPAGERVAVCEGCGYVCCEECGGQRCPRCGLEGERGVCGTSVRVCSKGTGEGHSDAAC